MASVKDLVITINDNNINIQDSYKVSKKDFKSILTELKEIYPENPVLANRKMFLLCLEWATHNFLYNIHFAISHTKDVDFNYPLSFKEKIAYIIVGILIYPFIK